MSAQHTPGPIHVDGFWSPEQWRQIESLARRFQSLRYRTDRESRLLARRNAASIRLRANWAERASIAKATGSGSCGL